MISETTIIENANIEIVDGIFIVWVYQMIGRKQRSLFTFDQNNPIKKCVGDHNYVVHKNSNIAKRSSWQNTHLVIAWDRT